MHHYTVWLAMLGGPALLVLPLFLVSLVNLFVAGPPLTTIGFESSGSTYGAALPFMKLGTLMVKTVSKPVAKALQASAKTNPTLRRGCIGLGNALHKLNFRINDLVDPEYRVKRVKPLEEAAALAKGSTFLGESFIFVVAAGVVVYEATDKAHKEKVLQQLL